MPLSPIWAGNRQLDLPYLASFAAVLFTLNSLDLSRNAAFAGPD
jgi:hypothetical protein